MDIEKMEENGTIDYYLELKKYVSDFVNRKYPLSQDDLRSILADSPTQNARNRQSAYDILMSAVEQVLETVSSRNADMLNRANGREATSYTMSDFQKEIFSLKQKILGVLWEKQHPEDKESGPKKEDSGR